MTAATVKPVALLVRIRWVAETAASRCIVRTSCMVAWSIVSDDLPGQLWSLCVSDTELICLPERRLVGALVASKLMMRRKTRRIALFVSDNRSAQCCLSYECVCASSALQNTTDWQRSSVPANASRCIASAYENAHCTTIIYRSIALSVTVSFVNTDFSQLFYITITAKSNSIERTSVNVLKDVSVSPANTAQKRPTAIAYEITYMALWKYYHGRPLCAWEATIIIFTHVSFSQPIRGLWSYEPILTVYILRRSITRRNFTAIYKITVKRCLPYLN